MDSLQLTLVTPLKKILEGVEVTEIKVPAQKGQLTIYPDHSPLVTTLETGVLSYLEKGQSQAKKAVITWGYCEVINGEVRLLAETAETLEQIDVDAAKKVKAEAEKSLASNKLNPDEIEEAQAALKKADAEIELSLN
ncbi:MAG: ATP synthase F1 subunit epsilon [Bdellovibrionales bacterium]